MMEGEGEERSGWMKLGGFYEFFLLSHLSPPIQFIQRVSKPQDDQIFADDHLFLLNVKLCNGKLVFIEACKRGFLSFGKQRILTHNLVDLLRQLSRAFDKAYDDLMKAFLERKAFVGLVPGKVKDAGDAWFGCQGLETGLMTGKLEDDLSWDYLYYM